MTAITKKDKRCRDCKRWKDFVNTFLTMRGKFPNYEIGICGYSKSDHYGHIVTHYHPACSMYKDKWGIPL